MVFITRFLILFLSLLLCSPAWATVGVVKYPSGTPVQVCQPSDTNSNCGGGGSSGVSSFNTRTGPVTLSSSDVTTALTFTPLNATKLGTVTSTDFCHGDGSGNVTCADGNTYVTGTPWTGLYLPLGGGTLTGNLTLSTYNSKNRWWTSQQIKRT